MYDGASTSVKLGGGESVEFAVKVGVHQGSVLSPLLTVHNRTGSSFKEVQDWITMGTFLC